MTWTFTDWSLIWPHQNEETKSLLSMPPHCLRMYSKYKATSHLMNVVPLLLRLECDYSCYYILKWMFLALRYQQSDSTEGENPGDQDALKCSVLSSVCTPRCLHKTLMIQNDFKRHKLPPSEILRLQHFTCGGNGSRTKEATLHTPQKLDFIQSKSLQTVEGTYFIFRIIFWIHFNLSVPQLLVLTQTAK